jgi:hypothetical protein
MSKYFYICGLIFTIILFFSGCKGPKGDPGPAGPDAQSGYISGNIIIQDSSLTKVVGFTVYILVDGQESDLYIYSGGSMWNRPVGPNYIYSYNLGPTSDTKILNTIITTPFLLDIGPGTYTMNFFCSYIDNSKGKIIYPRSKSVSVTIENGMKGDFGNIWVPEDFQ